MNKKGQLTVFRNIVTFIFLTVALIIVAILASVTTPFLHSQVVANNLTGGMAVVANYWNLIVVFVLLIVGLLLAAQNGVNS